MAGGQQEYLKDAMVIQHHDKRCQFCRFWQRGKWDMSRENASRGMKELANIYGGCSCPKFVYVAWDGKADADGLGYEDGEGCQANFYTGEDFGCRHWKEKT